MVKKFLLYNNWSLTTLLCQRAGKKSWWELWSRSVAEVMVVQRYHFYYAFHHLLIVLLFQDICRKRNQPFRIRHDNNDGHSISLMEFLFIRPYFSKSSDFISYNIMSLFISPVKYVNLENILCFVCYLRPACWQWYQSYTSQFFVLKTFFSYCPLRSVSELSSLVKEKVKC